MRSRQLHDALEKLTKAIHEVEAIVEMMETEHDPLASHIFISHRQYRNANDTKGGKRREMNARLSFNTACELGFRGSLDEWVRLRDGNRCRSHDAVIRVYDEAGNVIETDEHAREFKAW
jgi:hypothetical protein